MSIQFSAILTGLLFAAVFTIPQKAPAQATETGNTPQTTETEAIPEPPPHSPYLIQELLYQVNEVNRKLQAGVVVQCRCNDDYWWPIYNSVSDSDKSSVDDDGKGSAGQDPVDDNPGGGWWPEDYKIVRGYGYSKKEAKWDAMQACGPIVDIPVEPPEPPKPSTGDHGKGRVVDNIDDSLIEKAFIWCQKSKRFIHH